MLSELKNVLASAKSDADKINEIRQLLDSCFESKQVVELLFGAIGLAGSGMPWDSMDGAQMIELLKASTVPATEYRHYTADQVDDLRACLNHWATSIKIDPGKHIYSVSPLGKKLYSLRQGSEPKPESIHRILRELGLGKSVETVFVLQDEFFPNQAVFIDGHMARLVSKPNIFQWWAEVLVDNQKQRRLVEIRDIQLK